jgi:acyl-CoA-binding protein
MDDGKFSAACAALRGCATLSTREQLEAYALFKQASIGDAPLSTPFGPIAAAKRKAWTSKRGTSAARAKEQYVALAQSLVVPLPAAPPAPRAAAGVTPPPLERASWQGSAFQFASKGDHRSIAYLVSKSDAVCTSRDHRKRSLLHWSASSGSLALVERVLTYGLALDEPDADGLTPLDHAVWCQHGEIESLLRERGAARSSCSARAAAAAATAAARGCGEASAASEMEEMSLDEPVHLAAARRPATAAIAVAVAAVAAAATAPSTRDADMGVLLSVGDRARAKGHLFWSRQSAVFGEGEASASAGGRGAVGAAPKVKRGTIQHMTRALAGGEPAPPCDELEWVRDWMHPGACGTSEALAAALPEIVALLRAEQEEDAAAAGDGWRGGAETFQASLALSKRLLTTHWRAAAATAAAVPAAAPPSSVPGPLTWRGLRLKKTGELVGFCAAVPQTIRIRDEILPVIEINSLVVHPKWRGKRLTPALVQSMVLHGIDEVRAGPSLSRLARVRWCSSRARLTPTHTRAPARRTPARPLRGRAELATCDASLRSGPAD